MMKGLWVTVVTLTSVPTRVVCPIAMVCPSAMGSSRSSNFAIILKSEEEKFDQMPDKSLSLSIVGDISDGKPDADTVEFWGLWVGELGVHHDCAMDKGSQHIWLDFPTWIFVCTCPKQFREQRLSEHLHSHSVQTWETKAFHAMMMLVAMMGSSERADRSLVCKVTRSLASLSACIIIHQLPYLGSTSIISSIISSISTSTNTGASTSISYQYKYQYQLVCLHYYTYTSTHIWAPQKFTRVLVWAGQTPRG